MRCIQGFLCFPRVTLPGWLGRAPVPQALASLGRDADSTSS